MRFAVAQGTAPGHGRIHVTSRHRLSKPRPSGSVKENGVYQERILDQGLRILTSTMPHTCSVSVGFFIGVGSRYEAEQENGITHFIEHMLFKGTTKRPAARDIAVAIEGIGGIFNASTGRELTTYWAKVGQDHFSIALDVLSDMLLNSKLDEEELEKERGVIIEEINMTLDRPSDWVHQLAAGLIWPDHPLGRAQAGTKETVSGISRTMVQEYLLRHYQPGNAVLAIAGNVGHDHAVKETTAQLGDWLQKPSTAYLPMDQDQEAARIKLEHRSEGAFRPSVISPLYGDPSLFQKGLHLALQRCLELALVGGEPGVEGVENAQGGQLAPGRG